MKRHGMKRWLSITLAAIMLFSGSAYDFSDIVNAAGPEDTTVSENTLADVGEASEDVPMAGASEDGEALLIQDADVSSGVYYNAGSGMTDFRDETIYFVMTTRFYNGDLSNDVQCWDGTQYNGNEGDANYDPAWRGDFKGLIEKLDYIKALGFTAIWITPVVENCSGYDYHGYHAINFSKVDPRYESADCDYQDLIDAVHEKGMKIIQDVVFNHTGNFGEENLMPMFTKEGDLSTTDCLKLHPRTGLPQDYFDLLPDMQYQARLALMKNTDGVDHDVKNLYHHYGNFNWDDWTCQVAQIAGDCVDLNTENPIVYNYIVDSYKQYIDMGVDAFRIDTVRHISRLTFNKVFNDAFKEAGAANGKDFFMFGEVCTRANDGNSWYRGSPSMSSPYYTWKDTKDYAWSDNPEDWKINYDSAVQNTLDNADNVSEQPSSDNAFLRGNEYHTPDYSQFSGLNVIDFPMHWAFKTAEGAFNVAKNGDKNYNDATWNVTYVDSHDYAPDHAPEDQRFAGSAEQWAENLSLIFTFRGIPCIYYGSEIEFQKGEVIDKGPNIALAETGRAYFGDHIEGDVEVGDFGRYTNATGAMKETLNYPLSLHIQRLNRLRACIPALRKGQYSTENCDGAFAYKRRYTDDTTDSFVLVALTSDATFSNIPGGKYVDAITGDEKNVAEGGTLTTSGINGQGDLRVYVLDTGDKTPYLGMIDGKSPYMSGGTDSVAMESPVSPGQSGSDPVEATSITLDRTSASLDLGETVTLTATVGPSDATNKTVTWTSSNGGVATVNKGVVTAVNEGNATITAKTRNGLTATAAITVSAKGIKVTGVTLTPAIATLEKNDTLQLTASLEPSNAAEKYAALTWKSSAPKVATVDSNGLVTAQGTGTATITATTAYFGITATATIKVEGPKFTYMDGDAVYFENTSGWNGKIYAYFWDPNGTWKNAEWPGESMTSLNESAGIYGFAWPEGKNESELKVIFNNNSAQTSDLKAVVNGYYNNSGYVSTVDPNGDGDSEDITITGLTTSPASGSAYVGSSVKLTAAATGGAGALKYKFTVRQENGSESTIQDYKSGNTVTWTPQAAGRYTLKVYVKDSGSKNAEKTITNFEVKEQSSSNLPETGIQISFADKTARHVYDGREKKPAIVVKDGTRTLIEGTDYSLSYYDCVNAGDKDSQNAPTVIVMGKGDYSGKIINVRLTFTIEKAEMPEGAPESAMMAAAGLVANLTLNAGWEWSDSSKNIVLQVGETISASAVYNGTDKANYKTTTVSVSLTGISCDHPVSQQETIVAVAPTCTQPGRNDIICKQCHTTISTGEVIRALGHVGGTATCSSQAICGRCGEKYGPYDSTNHANIVVRNKKAANCLQTGYTGDAICEDCNSMISSGEPVAKTGHVWDGGKVTKAPTETANGVRTYTCTVCKTATRTETIPKVAGNGLNAGDSVIDPSSKAVYKVTRADSTVKQVEFVLPSGSAKTVTIPDNIVIKGTTYQVTSVAESAFKNNKTIQTVKMGSNVKTIGKSAFSGCSKLKKVTLSKNTTTIGSQAFYKCTKLTSITIPSKVSKIGSKAFYGCKKLKKITIKTTKLTSKKVGSQAFKGIAAKASIKVPKKKLASYKKLLKAKGVGSKAKIKK